MNDADYSAEITISAPSERIWEAITEPQMTRQFWYGAMSRSTWLPGARWTSESADGQLYLEGEIVEIEPPARLVHTMHVIHEQRAAEEAPSTVAWVLSARDGETRVLVAHSGLGPHTLEYVTGGWERILAGLKTLLEAEKPAASRPAS